MRKFSKTISLLLVIALTLAFLPVRNASAAADLKAPSVSVKTAETFYPKLTWEKVKGATSYTVYIKVPGASKYKKEGTTTKTSYIDRKFNTDSPNAIKYYVVATKGSKKSPKSNVVKWKPVALNSKKKAIAAIVKAIPNEKAKILTFTSTKKFTWADVTDLVYQAGLETGYIAEDYYGDLTRVGSTYVYNLVLQREYFKPVTVASTPDEAYTIAISSLFTMDFDDKYILCKDKSLFDYVELALLQHPEYGAGVYFTTMSDGSCGFSMKESGTSLLQKRYKKACEAADEILAEIIRDDMTETEKARAIHDYLVLNTIYDEGHSTDPADACYSAYGCLVEHSAVCMGYVAAFNLMANKVGLDSIAVVDKISEHSWNYVRVDGEYKYIDITWDDPTGVYRYDGSIDEDYLDHEFFLVDEDVIAYKHNDWDRELYSPKYVDMSLEVQ